MQPTLHRRRPTAWGQSGLKTGEKPSKLKRSGEMAKVLARYGFEYLTEQRSAWTLFLAPRKDSSNHKPQEHTSAERVRLVLEELGPTYIKLGQAASTRPDLIPEEYTTELAKLQDNAPEVPYREVAHVIKEDLGYTPETLFASFEKEPTGSASIGQVHRAVLSDGSQVVVKVQRPNLDEKVESDLYLLHDLVDFFAAHSHTGNALDIQGWFSEFEFTLRNELDFTREGRNADRFRRNFEGDRALYVPKIYWDYSCPRVLTMELIEGTKISDVDELRAKGIDTKQLARTATLIVLKMVYDHGFFHADPHAGNFFVLEDGRIALIDYGMVGRLDEELKDSLMRMALAVANRDSEQLTDEVMSFAYAQGRVDREALKRDISRVMSQHLEGGTEKPSMAKMLNETLAAAGQHGLTVPSTIALLARSFAMAEGLGSLLDPDFDFAAFAQPYLQEIFEKRYSREALMDRVKADGPFFVDMFLRLPKRADRIVSRIERGELAVITRIDNEEEILRHLHVAANRVSVSFITAALIVAVSILFIVYRPAGFRSWADALLITLIIVACGGGFMLMLSIWRAGKKDS